MGVLFALMRRRLSSAQTSGARFDALEAHRLAGAFRERSASSPARCTESTSATVAPVAHRFQIFEGRAIAAPGALAHRRPSLPFFIGAHAMVLGCRVQTRDVRRFKMYFPPLKLIAPE
jgi:hypothetical protein